MARMNQVQGTSARKILPREQQVPRKEKIVNPRIRHNRDKALQMDLSYIFVLSLAAICTLFICVQYLQIQASITYKKNHIEKLEKELSDIKVKNNALEASINTYVDLDYIYQVATEELGMVYVNKNQVIMYDRVESEYVRQNEDIPEK